MSNLSTDITQSQVHSALISEIKQQYLMWCSDGRKSLKNIRFVRHMFYIGTRTFFEMKCTLINRNLSTNLKIIFK